MAFCARRFSPPSYRLPSPQSTPNRQFHTSEAVRSAPRFTYAIAASFVAKDERYRPERDVFNFNPYNRIHARREDKTTRPSSGQDAFFVSRVGESSDVALGIADGVGGWVESGVDPADFSHGICDYMAHFAYTYKLNDPKGIPFTARSLMQQGYDEISKDKKVPAGGSTACVAIVKADGTLEVANLGDSGFVQLRLNAVHNFSEAQTHAFNTPYQLSVMSERARRQARFFGGTLMDFPRDANTSQHDLRHGDVLVFASDGLWDNLTTSDILRVVSRIMVSARAWEHTDKGISVSNQLDTFTRNDERIQGLNNISALQTFLAVGITGEAKAASVNRRLDGPFAREMRRYCPYEYWRGGKVDDICVVVAVVIETGK